MAGRQLYPNPYNNLNHDDLPPGWEMLHDHNTGWPYFIDHNTKSTSWEDPRLRMVRMRFNCLISLPELKLMCKSCTDGKNQTNDK